MTKRETKRAAARQWAAARKVAKMTNTSADWKVAEVAAERWRVARDEWRRG